MATKKDLKKAVKLLEVPVEIAQGANVRIYYKEKPGVTIISKEKWLMRLWLLVSNSFRYLFTGRVRY